MRELKSQNSANRHMHCVTSTAASTAAAAAAASAAAAAAAATAVEPARIQASASARTTTTAHGGLLAGATAGSLRFPAPSIHRGRGRAGRVGQLGLARPRRPKSTRISLAALGREGCLSSGRAYPPRPGPPGPLTTNYFKTPARARGEGRGGTRVDL